jgi:hypothetical protein
LPGIFESLEKAKLLSKFYDVRKRFFVPAKTNEHSFALAGILARPPFSENRKDKKLKSPWGMTHGLSLPDKADPLQHSQRRLRGPATAEKTADDPTLEKGYE